MRDHVDSSNEREEISSSVEFSVEEAESRDSRLRKRSKKQGQRSAQLEGSLLPSL